MKWDKKHDWFWEGNVQDKIIDYMKKREGFEIIGRSDTNTRQKGPDILAKKRSVLRQVAVKGYPSDKYTQDFPGGKKGEKKRTNPRLQAKHWLAEAIFEVVNAKSENSKFEIALGLPKFQLYQEYIKKLKWIIKQIKLYIYFVDKGGKVELLFPK